MYVSYVRLIRDNTTQPVRQYIVKYRKEVKLFTYSCYSLNDTELTMCNVQRGFVCVSYVRLDYRKDATAGNIIAELVQRFTYCRYPTNLKNTGVRL